MRFDELPGKLVSTASDTVRAVEEGIADVMADVLVEAKRRVPVDTGELRDSGRVVRDELGASVVFDADHAGPVHEDPQSPGYKFLTGSIDDQAEVIPDKIAAAAGRSR